jgi:hypothetical protein
MERSAVHLPRDVRPPFEVYVNGIEQTEGEDFELRGRHLVFSRILEQEGKIGFWRWLRGAWGIGTYRTHHSVDVAYHRPDGTPAVAQNLPVERYDE